MIVGFCNPLLDISATVDTAFLEKYTKAFIINLNQNCN